MNMIKSLGIRGAIVMLGMAAMIAACAIESGCVSEKVPVVTPVLATNASTGAVTTNYVTNTVVAVNQAVLAVDCAALQLGVTAGVPYVLKADPSLKVPLQDVNLVLQGVLNGGTTNSVSQLLAATGQTNAALAAQITPLIAQISAWEQAELKKFGATTYGQIVIPELTAVSAGLTAGLEAPIPQ